jgi:hypothetical protein
MLGAEPLLPHRRGAGTHRPVGARPKSARRFTCARPDRLHWFDGSTDPPTAMNSSECGTQRSARLYQQGTRNRPWPQSEPQSKGRDRPAPPRGGSEPPEANGAPRRSARPPQSKVQSTSGAANHAKRGVGHHLAPAGSPTAAPANWRLKTLAAFKRAPNVATDVECDDQTSARMASVFTAMPRSTAPATATAPGSPTGPPCHCSMPAAGIQLLLRASRCRNWLASRNTA